MLGTVSSNLVQSHQILSQERFLLFERAPQMAFTMAVLTVTGEDTMTESTTGLTMRHQKLAILDQSSLVSTAIHELTTANRNK